MFKLKLRNYRGFLDTEFVFSRINILIGENNGGKSSIFKFLLALKQSLRNPNNRDLNLTLSGVDVDLGNYQETIYNHESERKLFFSFEFSKSYYDFYLNYIAPINLPDMSDDLIESLKKNREDIINCLDGEIGEPLIISFELSNGLDEHSNISTKFFSEEIGEAEIIHSPNKGGQAEQEIYVVGRNPLCDIRFYCKRLNKTFLIKDVGFQKEAFLSILEGSSLESKIREEVTKDLFSEGNLISDEKKAEIDETTEKVFYQLAYLMVAQNYLSQQISGIQYLNPLLSDSPKRIYLEGDRKSTSRIVDISSVISLLSSSSTRPSFVEKLVNILSDLNIADEIYVREQGVTRELRIKLNGIASNIKDVGFGLSLQLPIFAQALLSENMATVRRHTFEEVKGETLLIEQPEVHLYPKLQAKFIDSLLQIGSNNTYFIETHSEHIIRMLQILIKEKRYGLTSEDISIHYFKKSDNQSVVSLHKVEDATGKLRPIFPEGFYDVSYDLTFELMN